MASYRVVVSVHGSIDLSHFLYFAVLWLENQNIVVANELSFIILIRSDSKIAKIFSHIDTSPIFVGGNLTGQESQRHTMSISRWGGRWSVGINMGINPDNLGVRHKSLHTSDGADGLRVISTENNWVVTLFESIVCLVSQLN